MLVSLRLDHRHNLSAFIKGQLISKANCQAVNSSKKEQMNSFLLLCDVFSYVFWKKLKTQKRNFEIN